MDSATFTKLLALDWNSNYFLFCLNVWIKSLLINLFLFEFRIKMAFARKSDQEDAKNHKIEK